MSCLKNLPFKALSFDGDDYYEVDVLSHNDVMTICAEDTLIYITRAQAAAFYGLDLPELELAD